MDITINIPIQESAKSFSVDELKRVLTDYAIKWSAQFAKKEDERDDEYELPAKFEKLCGCISQEKLEEHSHDDARMEYLTEKYLK